MYKFNMQERLHGYIRRKLWSTHILHFAMFSRPSVGTITRVVKWISAISAVATVLADVPL